MQERRLSAVAPRSRPVASRAGVRCASRRQVPLPGCWPGEGRRRYTGPGAGARGARRCWVAEACGSGPPARKGAATFQEVADSPPHKVAEILDGELVLSPRPAARHALSAFGLGGMLFGHFQAGGGGRGPSTPEWWILAEPELHLAKDVVVPDLAGWRRERMPQLADVAAFTVVPDWVCEVVSPATVRHDRSRKLRIYARESVAHAWLVDPLARTLEVYRLERGRWVVVDAYGGDECVRAEPFASVELPLGRLWLPSPSPSPEPRPAPRRTRRKRGPA
ncbi:MAG: Uma2 family endonuclease [Deltaproteobacteria bacterium]|nr:Uma2 family endonuclease [Deltaproteobacteria bacterium]